MPNYTLGRLRCPEVPVASMQCQICHKTEGRLLSMPLRRGPACAPGTPLPRLPSCSLHFSTFTLTPKHAVDPLFPTELCANDF